KQTDARDRALDRARDSRRRDLHRGVRGREHCRRERRRIVRRPRLSERSEPIAPLPIESQGLAGQDRRAADVVQLGSRCAPARSRRRARLQGAVTQLLNIFDYEREALEKLEKNALDYYRSGAHDEITLGDNRAAWDRIKLHYRVLVDVSTRSMETTILGHPISMPIVL